MCVCMYPFLLSLAPRHSGSAISIVPAACLCVSVCLHVCACECVCMRVNEGPMHIPLSILFISGVENMDFRGFQRTDSRTGRRRTLSHRCDRVFSWCRIQILPELVYWVSLIESKTFSSFAYCSNEYFSFS